MKESRQKNGGTFKVETAHAILRFADKYILQLRDDKPEIAARGQWSLFGGQIDDGEGPQEAIKRELLEELAIKIDDFKFLYYTDYYVDFVKGMVRTWFFFASVDNVWGGHKLKEGKDVGAFRFNDLKKLSIPDVMVQALNCFHSGKENPKYYNIKERKIP
jgi:8-oxo-dGTP pyrophosphatase MutT (NUDIX family)